MRINPLLAKELRLRMRTWHSFAAISLYLLVLGGFGVLFLYGTFSSAGLMYSDLSYMGRSAFTFLTVLQFALILFMVPGLTATLISSEWERQTFDLLICTQLSPAGIVLGKLASALSMVVLLILASLPLYGFIFMIGGVSPVELFIAAAIFIAVAVVQGSLAILLSALFRKTIVSVVSSYGLAFFLTGGLPIIVALIEAIRQDAAGNIYYLLLLSPPALLEWLHPEVVQQVLASLSRGAYPWASLSFAQVSLFINLLVAALALALTAYRINPLRQRRQG